MTGLIGYMAVLSRGVVAPLLDDSIMPLCSNNCIACIRANKFEKIAVLMGSVTFRRTVCTLGAVGPHDAQMFRQELGWICWRGKD